MCVWPRFLPLNLPNKPQKPFVEHQRTRMDWRMNFIGSGKFRTFPEKITRKLSGGFTSCSHGDRCCNICNIPVASSYDLVRPKRELCDRYNCNITVHLGSSVKTFTIPPQWRIQDFSEVGEGGQPSGVWFCELLPIERIWLHGVGRPSRPH